MKYLTASPQLKSLFQELVSITTADIKRRDWAILRTRNLAPFNQFSLKDLFSK